MEDAANWSANWAWSLPLIVLSVILHVLGLGFINVKVIQVLTIAKDERYYFYAFAVVMGLTTILATLLLGVEAGIWAAAYRALGALPDNRTALLYSLSAITTYGHADIFLAAHWRLMGALEALNGVILLGLTTAFMYGTIQRVWPVEKRQWHAPELPWPRRKERPE
jgi:MFS superfamily sulfate permease-like transporter